MMSVAIRTIRRDPGRKPVLFESRMTWTKASRDDVIGDTLFTFDQTESTNGSSTADMFAVMFTACRKTKSFATPMLKSRLVVKKPSPNRTFGLACCVAFITLRIRREFGRQ